MVLRVKFLNLESDTLLVLFSDFGLVFTFEVLLFFIFFVADHLFVRFTLEFRHFLFGRWILSAELILCFLKSFCLVVFVIVELSVDSSGGLFTFEEYDVALIADGSGVKLLVRVKLDESIILNPRIGTFQPVKLGEVNEVVISRLPNLGVMSEGVLGGLNWIDFASGFSELLMLYLLILHDLA